VIGTNAEDREILVRELQDDHGDGGPVNLSDAVAFRASGLACDQLVGSPEVFVPYLSPPCRISARRTGWV